MPAPGDVVELARQAAGYQGELVALGDDTLADERQQGLGCERQAGLTPDDERAIVASAAS